MIGWFLYNGERLFDLESVRRIVFGFVEKEKNVAVFNAAGFREVCSSAMQRVGKTVDAYWGEIATYDELSISKFNGIANLVLKAARKVDNDLFRIMDSIKLSYEARVHASRNKPLFVQTVLHALYYDQLKIKSNTDDCATADDAITTRNHVKIDASLAKENEVLRMKLVNMKMYIEEIKNKPINVAN